MEKYIEDVRQDEKDVPDLLEAIMRPTDPVKEELRPNLFKLTQFRREISKISREPGRGAGLFGVLRHTVCMIWCSWHGPGMQLPPQGSS